MEALVASICRRIQVETKIQDEMKMRRARGAAPAGLSPGRVSSQLSKRMGPHPLTCTVHAPAPGPACWPTAMQVVAAPDLGMTQAGISLTFLFLFMALFSAI